MTSRRVENSGSFREAITFQLQRLFVAKPALLLGIFGIETPCQPSDAVTNTVLISGAVPPSIQFPAQFVGGSTAPTVGTVSRQRGKGSVAVFIRVEGSFVLERWHAFGCSAALPYCASEVPPSPLMLWSAEAHLPSFCGSSNPNSDCVAHT